MARFSTILDRLGNGQAKIATAERAFAWLSESWSEDLDWPSTPPRPPRTVDAE